MKAEEECAKAQEERAKAIQDAKDARADNAARIKVIQDAEVARRKTIQAMRHAEVANLKAAIQEVRVKAVQDAKDAEAARLKAIQEAQIKAIQDAKDAEAARLKAVIQEAKDARIKAEAKLQEFVDAKALQDAEEDQALRAIEIAAAAAVASAPRRTSRRGTKRKFLHTEQEKEEAERLARLKKQPRRS